MNKNIPPKLPQFAIEVKLKRHLGLPFRDKGIDSLSLNLSVAVQAKDYAKDQVVPLNRLGTFYLLAQAGWILCWGASRLLDG